jgi:hypothetical protein
MCLRGCQETSRHLVRLQREWRRDVTVLLNNVMTVARISLTQLGYISEAVSRFSSLPGVTVKKAVVK